MGNTEEIIDVALRIKPEEVCLVPEKREEITTEGGLDVIAQRKELEPYIRRLQVAGIRVSLFIDPTLEQVDVAAELGGGNGRVAYRQACKTHLRKRSKSKNWNNCERPRVLHQNPICRSTPVTASITRTSRSFSRFLDLSELNIGHEIVSRAMWVGLENAVKEMLAAMANYPE